jgi:hypothetical protein
MKREPKELEKFTEATILLAENGWVVVEGSGERGGLYPSKWIAKTPQEIASIFVKYAVKPPLYKDAT